MGSQDLTLGSRVAHLRELKAEIAKLKAENKTLRDEISELSTHFDLALLASCDLRDLPAGGRFILMDGWNLILGARREARNPAELIETAKIHLKENPSDKIWIIFDGPRENSTNEGNLRISYTGGVGAHRADRMICDFIRMARFHGDISRIEVKSNDKEILKNIARIKGGK